jgi:carbon-monoxide dehydrogenase medium subunit
MYEFDHHMPQSLDAAAGLVAKTPDSKYLAGGQSLIPVLKQRLARFAALVDLAAIPGLATIERTGNAIAIGAMASHEAVTKSKVVRDAIPALAGLAGLIGDQQVRNRGTLGGSIANADPAADYPAALVALGATVHTNRRTIPAEAFFTGMFETALDPAEIVTRTVFPVPALAAYEKFPNPASRYAIVGVFVAKTGNGVRVAVTGAAPSVFRAPEMEKALGRKFAAEAIAAVSVAADGLNSDIHASAAYRAHLVSVMACRAVAKAAA